MRKEWIPVAGRNRAYPPAAKPPRNADESPAGILSVEQAASALGIKVAWMRRLCQSGRVPGAYRVGRAWLVPAESLSLIERRVYRK